MNHADIRKLAQGTLDFVGLASVLVKRAGESLAVHEAMQAKAAQLAPELFKLMKDAGAIPEGMEKAAEIALAEHHGTLMLLKRAVTNWIEAEKALQANGQTNGLSGQAMDTKKAGVTDQGAPQTLKISNERFNPNFLGARTTVKKASDQAMIDALNG